MRVAIVGASTLLGRELAEMVGETVPAADVILLDEEEVAGQMTAVGDEAAVIRTLERSAFEGVELCFFAGRAEDTVRCWEMARDAGAAIVDLTAALLGKAGVSLGHAWVDGMGGIDLAAYAVVPAHGVAVMLALAASRCVGLGLTTLAATVLLPASEWGRAGVDEMQQQAVNLLSFQPVPTEMFGVQVAFNLGPMREDVGKRIQADYMASRRGTLPEAALQVMHAPVFHGYGVSLLLGFDDRPSVEAVEGALAQGEHVEVMARGKEPPTSVSSAAQERVLVQVSGDSGGRTWVWMAADNMRLTALHAIACGMELLQVRPRGKVQ